jgi:3-dehydroquinate synthase
MSDSFEISASSGSYRVDIEPGAFAARLADHARDVVIADRFFDGHLQSLGVTFRAVLCYQASESIKSLDAAPGLIEQLRRTGANRETRLLAIGGGIIQDLVAFAASIYMRGVPWVYMPTTILGMVDSCIGGKSSINVGPYKNLVGTFHPPLSVLIDPDLAGTLPLDQQAGGMIEAAKICFCRGAACFDNYLACNPHPDMSSASLAILISTSLRAKKWFIEVDEFDQQERLLLNFGHTFGHAIEGASSYRISHGIAVGLGIQCALAFGRGVDRRGSDAYAQAPIVRALDEHLDSILRAVPGLSTHLAALPLDDVIERFKSDKKHKHDSYVLILVDSAGKVVLDRVARSSESVQSIRSAIQSVIGTYTP